MEGMLRGKVVAMTPGGRYIACFSSQPDQLLDEEAAVSAAPRGLRNLHMNVSERGIVVKEESARRHQGPFSLKAPPSDWFCRMPKHARVFGGVNRTQRDVPDIQSAWLTAREQDGVARVVARENSEQCREHGVVRLRLNELGIAARDQLSTERYGEFLKRRPQIKLFDRVARCIRRSADRAVSGDRVTNAEQVLRCETTGVP